MQRLAAASSLLDVAPRTTLIDENAPVKTLHTMVEGAVELLCERAERRFTLCVARGVKPLMLCAVLTGRSPFLARTLEPCRFVVTPAKPTMGGSWHCPNDGTKLIDFRCPHCGRSLPTGLVYDLIEFHPHA